MRRQLRTPWPWLGLCAAALLFAPFLAWQQVNGWPTLAYLRTHSEVIQGAGQGLSLNFDSGGALSFLELQPLLIGPLTLPIWLLGWYFVFRSPHFRPLGVATMVAFLVFLPVGKAYYPAPPIPVLLAAGCVQLEVIAERRNWTHLMSLAGGLMLVQAVVSLPISVPVVRQASLARFGLDRFRKDYADTVGWPQLVGQVAVAYAQLSPVEQQSSVILAANYGEAGAIDRYGPALGLPPPLSPNLTYWYWKPAHVTAQSAILIGFDAATAQRLFPDVNQVATVQSVDGVHNEEVGRLILLCRQPRVAIDVAWPYLQSFN
ncbi:MAG: hypothetical protein JO057_10470 [Chloroflexi bacterium]|nr:hypothetical protein [Chloroflexota bacterium]